jgi:hypothetical protein
MPASQPPPQDPSSRCSAHPCQEPARSPPPCRNYISQDLSTPHPGPLNALSFRHWRNSTPTTNRILAKTFLAFFLVPFHLSQPLKTVRRRPSPRRSLPNPASTILPNPKVHQTICTGPALDLHLVSYRLLPSLSFIKGLLPSWFHSSPNIQSTIKSMASTTIQSEICLDPPPLPTIHQSITVHYHPFPSIPFIPSTPSIPVQSHPPAIFGPVS